MEPVAAEAYFVSAGGCGIWFCLHCSVLSTELIIILRENHISGWYIFHAACGVLICECISPFNNVLHFLRVKYFISNPKQLKWLSLSTRPPHCPLHCCSVSVTLTLSLCFSCLCTDESVFAFKRRKVNAALNAGGLTSWQEKHTERK